jgi:hypothetical protein
MSNYRYFQMKRDDEAEWIRKNPILQPGEPGFSRDTNTMKVGDGIRRWTELDPIVSAASWINATLTDGTLLPLTIEIT